MHNTDHQLGDHRDQRELSLTVQKSSMRETMQMTKVDMKPSPNNPDNMYTTKEAACTP